jgi:hypothetical protein
MAKRDPFGRLPDENPLAGLGWQSDGSHSQAAEPVVVATDHRSRPAPAAPAMAASRRPVASDLPLAEAVRRAQAMGGVDVAQSVKVMARVVKLVVFLVVVGVIVSVGKPLVDVGKDARDAFDDVASSPSTGAGSEGAEQAVPTGLSASSMLRRDNFDRAMARLGTSGLGRMHGMSIRPERIDAQLLTRDGRLRSVQIRSDDPRINAFGTSGPGFSGLEVIAFARIDAAAPQRLARSAAGRARVPVSQVGYVTLDSSPDAVTWRAYMKSGGYFQANPHGRITRRFG